MKCFKKLTFVLFLAASISASAQNVKFMEAAPAAGKPVKFSYDPKGTKLEGKDDITCLVYTFASTQLSTTVPKLVKDGSVFSSEIPTTDSTSMVVLMFKSGDVADDNPQGYYVKLSKGGVIPASAYVSEGYLLGSIATYLGMKADDQKALASYEKSFEIDPASKDKSIYNYLAVKYKIDAVSGTQSINDYLSLISKKSLPAEIDLMTASNLYMLLKKKSEADSMKNIVVSKYPTGTYAFSLDYSAIASQKDPAAMEEKLLALVKKYGLDLDKEADMKKISYVYNMMVTNYGQTKNISKFEEYASKIKDKSSLAAAYNSVAWILAERNEEVAFAAGISKKSLDLVEAAKADAVPANAGSKAQYIQVLNRNYIMYADTYALLLHHLGKDKEAVIYQEKAIDAMDIPGNERYVMYLDLAGDKEKAFTVASKFLKEGQGTDAMRERLKSLYAGKKLKEPYAVFLANLEKEAKAKEQAEWAKKMISVPAPAFSLVNLKGETVSLASLKGKVVILDYWATWCGPCVASFPGMQKAVNKYASNPNVVFLFINTSQRETNREELVKKFMADTKYTFNVLLDTKNKENPNLFDVITAYKVEGIPTKFVIDGDGVIRFKAVGFSGSADAVVTELDAMISMASAKSAGSK
ncbi:redoxin domain-containing protein [Pedobacter metabolipauper]|uniref:Peroxiredoxin n=1 Tax=Pedobacter metabolipauper TaxID=425513 RepID=A0A4V3D0T5_9SPHI|nr:redoxin domain-containing protein [Pedobacter metabolipauper]TDQ07419.1 peroxiredoxin [Pedobacter metabolipauper]